MAQLFPKIDTIKKLNPFPTNGELALVTFLNKTLSDDYEIYFQPFINGDKPDIVLMKKDHGVIIIEVKDWQLKHYYIEKNEWKLRHNKATIRSPIAQVNQYKNSFFDLHIPGLLESKIKNQALYGIIKTQVYFHKETQNSLDRWTIDRKIDSTRYCSLIGSDSLDEKKYENLLNKQYFSLPNSLFDRHLYKEFSRLLQPSINTIEAGSDNLELHGKQKKLVKSEINKHQKVKGVAGSGKTFVLAQRAVNSHLRHNNRVLILTYNITLRNYIHDHISRIRDGLNWKFFYVMHYHGFFKIEANNLEMHLDLNSFNRLDFFDDVKDKIVKFDAIFIDEIQDYESEWIEIIKKYFLADNGEFVVFGDEKQNIYHRQLSEDNKPNTTIPGAWSTLTDSYRFSNKIVKLLNSFQKTFFTDMYSLDTIVSLRQQEMFVQENIQYIPINRDITIDLLVDEIETIMKNNNTHPNDACILGSTVDILRLVDLEIRKRKENTMTTFETQETFDLIMKKEEYKNYSHQDQIEDVRRNKKFNFWMNPGTIKLSTIHSFKGWEISTLFLIINPKEENEELLYTAITRCRHNLFILNIENDYYDVFFKNNISDIYKDTKQISISKASSKIATKDKTIDVDLAFDAMVEGMKSLGWLEKPESKKGGKKAKAFGAIVDGMKDLGWDVDSLQETHEGDSSNETTKTIGKVEESTSIANTEYLKRNIKVALTKLKGNHKKYKIFLLGQISCEKKELEAELNKFFAANNLSYTDWEIEFCIKPKEIKKYSLANLKIKQSGYSLLITGNLPAHSSKGNPDGNIMTSLSKGGYIKRFSFHPRKTPTKEQIIGKLENYLIREIEQIKSPSNIVDYYK